MLNSLTDAKGPSHAMAYMGMDGELGIGVALGLGIGIGQGGGRWRLVVMTDE